MLEFSSTLCTKLVCGWIRYAAGRTGDRGAVPFGFTFACTDFTPDQRVEIGLGFDIFNLLKNESSFCAHFATDFPIVLIGKLAALIFKVEVLDIAEHDFFLALKQVPLRL